MADTVVLFGAFDRHNFGDLLFPHIAEALLGRDTRLLHAGLVTNDLRAVGGHAVQALSVLAAQGALDGATLIHVGGETLACDAWLAALMLLRRDELEATIGWLGGRTRERNAWVRERLGTAALAPYVVGRERAPGLHRILHAGVGGCALAAAAPALRDEVLASLRSADALGVRDALTLAQLASAGLPAQLLPDPAVLVAELFGTRIAAAAAQGEVAQLHKRFARGYLAVQFSAEFGDDATLDVLAAQLDEMAAHSGLGLVLFRAGAAPFHDDLTVLERAAARLRAPWAVFESLQLWDICALVARASGFAGSSLHGRIVAMAVGRPRISLRSPRLPLDAVGKQAAFAAAWELPGLPGEVAVDALAAGWRDAWAAEPAALQALAKDLAARYRHGFAALCRRAGV
ncbi:MAG TPA: polysaccharide pyruvyl transferase family protein [Ideonella sp.]|jgi:hypothetical protein|nr:polysaccharide pyruvyl transferase family protein [Ideonella sp.]